MNLLDTYLHEHTLTRYKLSIVSGISTGRLTEYNRKPLNNYSISLIRALSSATGDSTVHVLAELEKLEAEYDQLLGFRVFLEQHNVSFPDLELELYTLIKKLEACRVKLKHFTFNRFEEERHVDIKKDCEKTIINAIEMLSSALESVRNGKKPNDNW